MLVHSFLLSARVPQAALLNKARSKCPSGQTQCCPVAHVAVGDYIEKPMVGFKKKKFINCDHPQYISVRTKQIINQQGNKKPLLTGSNDPTLGAPSISSGGTTFRVPCCLIPSGRQFIWLQRLQDVKGMIPCRQGGKSSGR